MNRRTITRVFPASEGSFLRIDSPRGPGRATPGPSFSLGPDFAERYARNAEHLLCAEIHADFADAMPHCADFPDDDGWTALEAIQQSRIGVAVLKLVAIACGALVAWFLFGGL